MIVEELTVETFGENARDPILGDGAMIHLQRFVSDLLCLEWGPGSTPVVVGTLL
jgi:hypothetical protein